MFMNMFVCLSTSQTNEHWPLIGRTNEHDLTNTVRLFIGHPAKDDLPSTLSRGMEMALELSSRLPPSLPLSSRRARASRLELPDF